MSITYQESFSDNYQAQNEIIYPLEYMKFPIEERMNLYRLYTDDFFLSEGLKIIEKYIKECNPENKDYYYIMIYVNLIMIVIHMEDINVEMMKKE